MYDVYVLRRLHEMITRLIKKKMYLTSKFPKAKQYGVSSVGLVPITTFEYSIIVSLLKEKIQGLVAHNTSQMR